MKRIEAPGPNVPIQQDDGSISPAWYAYLTRGVLDMKDVDVGAGISNGQVLTYNATTKKLVPGAN